MELLSAVSYMCTLITKLSRNISVTLRNNNFILTVDLLMKITIILSNELILNKHIFDYYLFVITLQQLIQIGIEKERGTTKEKSNVYFITYRVVFYTVKEMICSVCL